MTEKDQKIFDNTIDTLINSAASDVINEMFDEIDTSINDNEITFSDKHTKEINKILASEKHNTEKIKYHRINKRILLVAIITMVIILVTALSVGADRLKFLNYFMNINKTDTEFRKDDKIYEEEYSTYDESENQFEITLNYIPNNFELSDVTNVRELYSVRYTNGDKYFDVDKGIVPDSYGVDTENAKTKYVDINGNKAFLSSKPEVKILTWISNNILYQVDGNIDEETLITIAKNLK